MNRFYKLLLTLSACSSVSFAQQVPADTALRTGKLSNGLTYFVRRNSVPKATADFYIVQKVGSILEEDHQRGLAHFLEHMAFNGTKNFPGRTLITEMEKRGVSFGKSINAYTAFDQTVYNLSNIPISRAGLIDTALLILHDWSGSITNDDKEIDEERGVIREEWRARSSSQLRMMEKQILPVLLAGTPYANRLPIGTIEVVNNFKPDALRAYYKKWYRPDLQGIIIVGDVNPDQIVAHLKKMFADVPAPIAPAPRLYVNITDNVAPIIAIASDPEVRAARANIYWKQPMQSAEEINSAQYFKVKLMNNIISNMLNQRFAELSKKNGTSFTGANGNMGKYSESLRDAWKVSFATTANDVMPALQTVLSEMKRMKKFGFNRNEFEPTIRNFNLSSNETSYIEKNNLPNGVFVKGYVTQFLAGIPVPSTEWNYKETKAILTTLTIDTLNYYAKKYITDNNMALEFSLPEKNGQLVPSKEQVSAVWNSINEETLVPWVKEIKENDLSTLKTPTAGQVIKTERNTKPYGYTKWTLSNGVKVWFKETHQAEAQVYVNGYKPGGYSVLRKDELPSAAAFNEVIQFAGLDGFDGSASGGISLNRKEEYLSAQGNTTSLEALFQYVYLQMTKVKKQPEAFNNWKNAKLKLINNKNVSPMQVFQDTLTSVMRNRNPWSIALDRKETLEQVDYDKVVQLHQDRFGNARDFTFIITGSVSADSVKKYIPIWLGGLPSNRKKENIIDHHLYPPKGVIKHQVIQKMATPKSAIVIAYSGEIPFTLQNQILMEFTTQVLSTIYLNRIREQEGGSYGVSVNGEIGRYPKERFLMQVGFDTDPDPVKKKKLISIVYEEIARIQQQSPPKAMVAKIKADLLIRFQQSNKDENARYWSAMAASYLYTGIDQRSKYELMVNAITGEMIKRFAKKIFSQENIIEATLDPKQ